jgi:branched-subunit amino acid transport protein
MPSRELRNLALVLIGVSVVLYGVDFLLFRNAHDLFSWLILDLAFLPLSVLLVTLVVNGLLAEREKSSQQHKMHMVISAFFSEVGTPLLRLMGELVPDSSVLCGHLGIDPTWDEKRMRAAQAFLRETELPLQATPERLRPLRSFLAEQREFMIRLLENPVLLEHEQFTSLLWAVFHLEEELAARGSLEGLPANDLRHLEHDADRALKRLLGQWLSHMIHLREDYPFLFSFEARTNPLRSDAKVEIE